MAAPGGRRSRQRAGGRHEPRIQRRPCGKEQVQVMSYWTRVCGVGALWLACGGLAAAQQDASADLLIAAARQVAQQVDDDRAGEAWDAASPVLRARIARERFVAEVRAGRKPFAAMAGRTWASVARLSYAQDAEVPAGLYGNIDFSTRLADGSTMFELVTLRQEADGAWRLIGYVPRRNQ